MQALREKVDDANLHTHMRQAVGAQLRILSAQLAGARVGHWSLRADSRASGADADPAYVVIASGLLGDEGVEVRASTILHYVNWWLSGLGLRYMWMQRSLTVRRVFYFPDGALTWLFGGLGCAHPALSEAIAGEGHPNVCIDEVFTRELEAEQVLGVLMMHAALYPGTKLVTPRALTAALNDATRTPEDADTLRWWEQDVMALSLGAEGDSPYLCASVRATQFPSAGLEAADADLWFAGDELGRHHRLLDRVWALAPVVLREVFETEKRLQQPFAAVQRLMAGVMATARAQPPARLDLLEGLRAACADVYM
jgi:hypothetical protein